MTQEQKELLRIEYYKVMEYSQPFGNEHHEELFEWFISKLEKQKNDLNPLQIAVYAVNCTNDDKYIDEVSEMIKTYAIKFADWIGQKTINDSWFKYSKTWNKWYLHTKGHLTSKELFEIYARR